MLQLVGHATPRARLAADHGREGAPAPARRLSTPHPLNDGAMEQLLLARDPAAQPEIDARLLRGRPRPTDQVAGGLATLDQFRAGRSTAPIGSSPALT
eukprot:SAG22_NODE_1266_length_4956_cov_3.272184_1_plen_98_part_00